MTRKTLLKSKKFWVELSLIMFICFSFASVADASVLNPNDTTGLEKTIETAANNAAKAVRGIVGLVAAVFLIWGGLLLGGAGGDTQKVQMAKEKFKYTIYSLIVVILADKIVGFVTGVFTITT
ncbi:pilin [Paenibacillus sp. Leaf72]|uniref:pilin n=1 Tax=Paenibacillus sp. Leaf72 TaxID=1736234 RepID=UPI0006F5D0AD|nr:pilin [Paenibacillus sp. Leaf72]KQN97038.1 hypothetical protein ASF12_23500 [Paenibacillus sp. Leaf72]